MAEYLTAKQVIRINQQATGESGDPFAVENEGNLNHAIDAVKYKYERKDLEDAIVLKAAFLLDMLANKGHVFVEGNKRTAIIATIAFLDLNGYKIDTKNQEELVAFVLNVAKGGASLNAVAKWLRGRIKKA